MITQRKSELLKTLVRDYIYYATPIASERFTKDHSLGVSPATVRNYMSELEEQGYVTRPHQYAGAIPSDKGYRFYVESLPAGEELPGRFKHNIRYQFNRVQGDTEDWTRIAAVALSRVVNNAAVVTYPKRSESRFLRINLVYIQESLAFLILVLEKVQLRKQLLPLIKPLSNDELQLVSNKLSDSLKGLNRREIMNKHLKSSPFEQNVTNMVLEIMKAEDEANYGNSYVHGLKQLLNQPEFSNGQKAREIIDVMEDEELPNLISSEAPQQGGMKVVIGEEHRTNSLYPLSMVICQYGLPGGGLGSISALGPTRMEYSRAISGVRFVASLMTDLFAQIQNISKPVNGYS